MFQQYARERLPKTSRALPQSPTRPNITPIMMILKTTLVCLLGLGLTACVSEAPESTPSDNKPAANKTDIPAADKVADSKPAANKTDTPVAAKVAMTSTALTLSKVP